MTLGLPAWFEISAWMITGVGRERCPTIAATDARTTQKTTSTAPFRFPSFRHSFIGPRPTSSAAGMAKIGTFLPFPRDLSNGRSDQQQTFGIYPIGIAERKRLGRLLTGWFWHKDAKSGPTAAAIQVRKRRKVQCQ
ncbi:hypothetical protein NOVOSPHI9U_380021 [Novosphingobium sp. 9U]|nr:hypothetical protein NOVOSPHI9U_380021 [Novosphingobium sp. 9U]